MIDVRFFLDTPTFEYFFKDKLKINKRQYVTSYEGDYSFLYVRMLQKLKINSTLCLFSSEANDIEIFTHKPTGCKIKFFPSPQIHTFLDNLTSRKPLLNKGFYSYVGSHTSTMSFRLLNDLKLNKPDIIYQQEYETGRFDVLALMAKRLHIPLVAQYHWKDPSLINPMLGFHKLIKKNTIRLANKILCVNKDECKRVQSEYQLSPEKVEYVPNPVQSNEFVPAEKENAKNRLGLAADKKYVLFVGRLVNDSKGITYLLDAFKQITETYSDVHLLIVGVGPDENYLMEYCNSKKIPNTKFVGWVNSRDTLHDFYVASEFLVCPSLAEAFGLVNLESMASGVPVIGSNVGGIKDIILDGETGFLVEPKNSMKLSEKMLVFLEDSKLTKKMGRASRKRVEEHFSCDAISKKLKNIFEVAITEGN